MAHPADVTLILCSRERPRLLRDALASVVSVTSPDVEVVVVDSGSTTDATGRVAREAGVRTVRTDIRGLSIARNVGLRASEREIVVYTDDDCVVTAGWLEAMLRHFDAPDVGVVTGRMLDHTKVGSEQAYTHKWRFTDVADGLDAGHGALMAFRRKPLLALGGFDEVLGAGRELAGAEDLDAFCRMIDDGWRIVHEPDSIVHHVFTRVGENYRELLHGYGLGMGALANKWSRIDKSIGRVMLTVVLSRQLRKAARALPRRRARARAELAMATGIVRGYRRGSRLRLDGKLFVDASRPAPIVLSGGPAQESDDPAGASNAPAPLSREGHTDAR
ncbi:glycosyltransferase involved in cell wall biosynthesis [Okibacterium sp. HSC-33S16]|uniref:glycosyltransferase n=1 Tax=Okibacterium sp. HSC-33S16 TaxID=2910965 RepID=UPI00209FB904|nr:glycosyltransferase [Okibacterium sp. HSC-33S16]MCP2032072.1 glycosyltransferase involved in cell wall biosynthesis [Okibacterium sp. HSC-33S16]